MRADTVLLLVLVALAMAGNGLVVPILSLYGATFSASTTLVGMLITVFGVARLVANFPAGLAYARFGPKTLMALGNALLLAGAAGAALSTTIEALLLCRAVQGAGSGIFLTAAGVVIAQAAKEGARGRAMALYQASVHVGAGIGPAIGGVTAQAFGLSAPFWAYAALCFVSLAVSLRFDAGGTGPAAPPPKAREPNAVRGVLASVLFLGTASLAFSSAFTRTAAHWQMIPLLAHERFGMGYDLIGAALAVTAFANVAVLPAAGRLVDRVGARRMAPLSALSLAASLFVIAWSSEPAVFWAGMALLGVAGGLVGPAVSTLLIEITTPETLPPALGAQRTCGDLGFVLGPVLSGLFVDATALGPSAGIAAIGALVVASAIGCAVALRTRRAKIS